MSRYPEWPADDSSSHVSVLRGITEKCKRQYPVILTCVERFALRNLTGRSVLSYTDSDDEFSPNSAHMPSEVREHLKLAFEAYIGSRVAEKLCGE